jgi:hypothetical protein
MLASASYTIIDISDGFTKFHQYAKTSSNETAPTTGWSADMPSSEAGKFIWSREGYALTYAEVSSWANAMCLTGSTGYQGASAQSFQIITNSQTYALSSRGVVMAEKIIIITCIKANIPDETIVNWVCTTLGISSTTGASITITIPSGSELTEIPITCTVSGFPAQTLKIQGIKDGDAVPIYLHVLSTSNPALNDHFQEVGGKFIAGDYFLYSTQLGNFPKWYDGESWNVVDENTPNYSQICSTVLADSLKQSNPVLSTSAIFGYFETLISNDAFIKKLGAQIIKLLTGGAVHSDYYLPNGEINPNSSDSKGVFLGADGTFNAVNANLVNAVISGSGIFKGIIDSLPLTTTVESDSGLTITFTSKTHWLGSEIYSLVPLTESQSLQTISGSYQSKAFTKATKLASSASAIISINSIYGSKLGNSYTTIGSTTLPSGSSSFTYSVSLRSSSSKGQAYAKLIVGGSTAASWQTTSTTYVTYTGTLVKNTGTTISVQVQGGSYSVGQDDSADSYGYASATFSFLSTLTGKGIFLGYSDGTYGLIGTGVYGNSLTMTGYTPVYNYAKNTAFLGGVSSYTEGVMKAASGTITYNGNPYTITGVMKSSSISITVFHSEGSLTFASPDSDPGTSGYYNASGSYAVIASVAGAEMMSINAKEIDIYSIGNIRRFLNIIGKNGIFSNVIIGNSNLGTNGYAMLPNGLHIEWGYVSCSSTGQVHTSTTVTFNIPFSGIHTYWAGITAGDSTGSNGLFSVGINSRYTGSIVIASYGVNSSTVRDWMHWVAIGY